jgi:DNA-binding NarL/FixJ family response regulator
MTFKKVKIAIADDHQVCRDGLASMLDPDKYDIVGEADNGIRIIELAKSLSPDIILMDIQMPEMDGIEATKIISNTIPNVQVIALSIHGKLSYITEMIDAGASGYVLKTASKIEIIDSIQSVLKNRQYYCKETSLTLSKTQIEKNNNSRTKLAFNLSDIEIKIIRLICDEYKSEAIGRLLFLSKRTIDGARLRIQSKLNVSSTAGIVKFAIENGIYRGNSNNKA